MNQWAVLVIACAFVVLIQCDRKKAADQPAQASTAELAEADGRFTTPDGRDFPKGKQIAPPDLLAASQSPQFQAAVARAAALTQSRPKPLERADDDSDKPCGAMMFQVAHADAEKRLDAWRKELLSRGAYLVRYDNSFGIGVAKDVLALVPTTDKYVVLAAMQTNGANFDIMTGDIIEWLKGMEKTQPWELSEAGMDYLAGKFTSPIKNVKTLAAQMYEFCPDIVDQGTGDVDKLASELRKGKLYFWWD